MLVAGRPSKWSRYRDENGPKTAGVINRSEPQREPGTDMAGRGNCVYRHREHAGRIAASPGLSRLARRCRCIHHEHGRFGAVYSYGAFSAILAATFHLSTTSTSIILSLSTGTIFAVSAISGLLTERFGRRSLSIVGMFIVALGLLLAAKSRTATQIYLCYGALVGLGTGLAYVPAFAAVQRWFVTWRGLASGIAASGIGVGTFLIHPMAEFLCCSATRGLTFKICGIMVAVVGTLGALLLSDSPEQYAGEQPDDTSHRGLPSTSVAVIPLREAVRSGSFTRMYCAIFLVSLPVTLPYAYVTSSAVSNGFELGQAMTLISILGIGSIVCSAGIALTADRFGWRQMFLMCCVGLSLETLYPGEWRWCCLSRLCLLLWRLLWWVRCSTSSIHR